MTNGILLPGLATGVYLHGSIFISRSSLMARPGSTLNVRLRPAGDTYYLSTKTQHLKLSLISLHLFFDLLGPSAQHTQGNVNRDRREYQ
jgi:hypothetical protein